MLFLQRTPNPLLVTDISVCRSFAKSAPTGTARNDVWFSIKCARLFQLLAVWRSFPQSISQAFDALLQQTKAALASCALLHSSVFLFSYEYPQIRGAMPTTTLRSPPVSLPSSKEALRASQLRALTHCWPTGHPQSLVLRLQIATYTQVYRRHEDGPSWITPFLVFGCHFITESLSIHPFHLMVKTYLFSTFCSTKTTCSLYVLRKIPVSRQ